MTTVNLFRHAQDTKAFAAGQVIFHAGEPGEVMYAVQEGDVDILVGDKTIDHIGPGGIFGEMALIDNSPRSATAIARTDCKLVEVNHKRFEFMVQQTPRFALTVMQIMAERLRKRIAELSQQA
jgi:CRP/FNR family transcriptional regulator, cyclic AMP receptor protein